MINDLRALGDNGWGPTVYLVIQADNGEIGASAFGSEQVADTIAEAWAEEHPHPLADAVACTVCDYKIERIAVSVSASGTMLDEIAERLEGES